MAAPFFSTPFQPYVYQSHQGAVVPFQILGGEAQVVQIMLKPQEKIIAKPGSMCFMSGSIEMENVLIPENEVGVWQWFFGKAVTSVIFRNPGPSDGFVGIATPSLARILPIDLAKFGGEILCQPDAFLCSVNDVKVSNALDHRARNVVPTIEVFLRQKLTGQGLAFILAGGSGTDWPFRLISVVWNILAGFSVRSCLFVTPAHLFPFCSILYIVTLLFHFSLLCLIFDCIRFTWSCLLFFLPH
ncbi:BIOGENESIS PROTEIN-RELATED [Salix koriyanagi]|uniref:BIOGENESIS PROTEIN-RELATED n=1 Tax=Salix koriyanagi TaxID=2511006 RepID=A0A9Q0PX37_9ROSI|nr:BIOGENESIS PROTEIN-RELATED [Salix koriyanagi]